MIFVSLCVAHLDGSGQIQHTPTSFTMPAPTVASIVSSNAAQQSTLTNLQPNSSHLQNGN